jgi:hypothetical protein
MNDLNFLQQLIARWKASSPTFFKVITTLSAITAFITGIPMLLTDLGVNLPSFLVAFENKTVAIAATVGALIAKLTVATPSATNQVLNDTTKK